MLQTVIYSVSATEEEKQRLESLEKVIETKWQARCALSDEIAQALLEIKIKKLYRIVNKTWAAYCAVFLRMTERGVRYALNRHEVNLILRGLKRADPDYVDVTNENRKAFPILDRPLTEKEVKSVETLDGDEKVAAVAAMAQSPVPLPVQSRSPRMPPPRVIAVEQNTEALEPKEPEVQKAECPLDNAQLHWVVMEIENWYQLNRAAVNCVPPPTPMALVSKIQRHLQNLKR